MEFNFLTPKYLFVDSYEVNDSYEINRNYISQFFLKLKLIYLFISKFDLKTHTHKTWSEKQIPPLSNIKTHLRIKNAFVCSIKRRVWSQSTIVKKPHRKNHFNFFFLVLSCFFFHFFFFFLFFLERENKQGLIKPQEFAHFSKRKLKKKKPR